MTQTLSQVIAAYQQRGHRLWTGEPLKPADIEMLNQLRVSPLATKAFALIMKGAAQTHTKRLEEAAKRREEAKAFAKKAEGAVAQAFAKMMEDLTRSFAKKAEGAAGKTFPKMKKEETQACVRTLKDAAAREGGTMQAFAKRQEEAAAKALDNIAPPEMKALFLVDDCVTAHRYYTGEHEAQVERLHSEPNYQTLRAKLESLAKDYGVFPEDIRESFGRIRVDLYYRQSDHEYNVRSISRKGDKVSARSRAVGWVKESVRRLSGQGNFEHVATLCDVVLDTDQPISLDAVRRAITPREWLDKRF
jgi:hypothetical protein